MVFDLKLDAALGGGRLPCNDTGISAFCLTLSSFKPSPHCAEVRSDETTRFSSYRVLVGVGPGFDMAGMH